jgi:lipopolysaccharide biosynthesis regulator YciM
MQYHLMLNNIDQAVQICHLLKTINYKNAQAYLVLSDIYMSRGNLIGAEQELLNLIDIGRIDDHIVQKLMKIFQSQGLNERAATKKLYKILADSFKKQGMEDLYYEYQQAYERL